MDCSPPAAPSRPLRVLVAPLDWGLGHTTRCIPVIYELLKLGCKVSLAGNEAQKALLNREFTRLPFLQLKGYEMRYGKGKFRSMIRLLFKAPSVFRAIANENNWLAQAIREHQFDVVISDNRFGLYHPSIPCYFITHQLQVKSPFGNWTEGILRKMNYHYINRFSECWIPDFANDPNLAGDLSHPSRFPKIPCHFIGALSRFKSTHSNEDKDHLFISLSGPEPQRSIFENLIVRDIAHYEGTACIVRGLPDEGKLIPSTNSIRFYNHLSSEDFKKELSKAEWVISRSGYSTIMDIAAMRKKSIMIPTPGQTEQEYLASYLHQKRLIFATGQVGFSLPVALASARNHSYADFISTENNLLSSVVESVIRSLKANC
jgi:uncharacterized protein (TIGR00661 family)